MIDAGLALASVDEEGRVAGFSAVVLLESLDDVAGSGLGMNCVGMPGSSLEVPSATSVPIRLGIRPGK